MADITVTTDFSQVNNLKDALQSADTAYVRVVDGIVRENNRLKSLLKKAAKDTEETNKIKEQADAIYTAKLQQEADKRERVRAREAAKAEKEAQRIAAANEKAIASEVKLRAATEKKAAASAQNFQSQVGPNLGLGARGISAGASGSAFEAEIERLRQKYDGVYASSQLYERSLNELNKTHALGILSAKQHEAAVESLNAEYQNFQNGTAGIGNRFAQNVQQNMAGVNNAGVLMQQLGFQAGDFIVQVQSGTNAFVAFGQQATQLVGFLPMLAQSMGAATVSVLGFNVAIAPLTLGLSIIIPLLTAAGAFFMRTGESAKEASTKVDEFEDRIRSLDSALKDYLRTKNAASLGITTDELTSVEAMTKAISDLNSANAQLSKITSSTKATAAIGGTFGATAFFSGRAEEQAQTAIIAELEAKREDALNRINILKQRSVDLTTQEAKQSQSNYELEYARLKFGEDSAKFKELEAKQARDAYEQEVRRQGLNVENLMKQYDAQQAVLKGLREEQSEREKLQRLQAQQLEVMGRTQAEQAAKIEAAIIRANQAYAKTRVEAAAAQAALKEALSSKDAEQLNRAMEDALSAGLEFSRVDLNAIVALAAKNGWSLAGAIRAAAQAAQVGNVVTANPAMGPGFEGGGRNRDQIVQETYKPTFSEIYAQSLESGGGGGDKKDPLEELRQQIKLENELLGVSEAQARVIQALGMDRSKYSQAEIDAITAEIEAYNQKQEAIERTKEIMDTVKSSMEDAFMSMVDGTKSAKDAFKSMAAEIIKELYRVLVVQQLVNGISGAIGGIFGGSAAPVSSPRPMANPFLQTRASGGPISANTPYLVGEKGPELVIPRHSGTVVNAAQTAQAMGSGSGAVTVQNNITVTGSDAAMVRTEIAKMIPQITNATKAAVIDAKQRGGQMAAAFR